MHATRPRRLRWVRPQKETPGHDAGTGRGAPRHRRVRRWWPKRRRLRAVLISFGVVVVLAGVAVGVVAYRIGHETVPVLEERTVLPAEVHFPGSRPALAWPTQGQAAVVVAGLGSLGQSGPQAPQPIASVAKLMTAYVILHDFPLAPGSHGFTLGVTTADVDDTRQRAAQAQSVVAVAAGETLTEYQLLEGLLVPSANNFAVMLADYDGGMRAFLAKMNSTAASLGMHNTRYTDPSGLDPTTVSTAVDQTVMGEAVMQEPVVAQIVSARSVTLPVAGTLDNFDNLIGTDGFVGIKPGTDSVAGGSFVFADQRKVAGHPVTIYGAVLGQDVGQVLTPNLLGAVFGASRRLVASAAAALSVATVLPAGTPVLTVTNAEQKVVVVTTTRPIVRLGWGGTVIPLRVATVGAGRRLAEGEQLATVSVGPGSPAGGGVGADATAAVATSSMPRLSFGWKLRHAL